MVLAKREGEIKIVKVISFMIEVPIIQKSGQINQLQCKSMESFVYDRDLRQTEVQVT